MDVTAIDVRNLHRYYGPTRAVCGVTFSVRRGESFGFLGPNGAGKTTTLNVLTTLLAPTSGDVTVLGLDVRGDGLEIRRRIGVVQQQPSYEPELTVKSQMGLYAYMWGIPKADRHRRVEDLLERFGLKEHANKKPGDLSIGLRRRLQIARELVHDVNLLFLDEPTIGLDPIAKRRTLDFLKSLTRKGLTIFLSTNNMSEAESLCDRVCLINRGRVVRIANPRELVVGLESTRIIDIELRQGAESLLRDLKTEFPDLVTSAITGSDVSQRLSLQTNEPESVLPRIFTTCDANGWKVMSIAIKEPSLEDVFVKLIGTADEGFGAHP